MERKGGGIGCLGLTLGLEHRVNALPRSKYDELRDCH